MDHTCKSYIMGLALIAMYAPRDNLSYNIHLDLIHTQSIQALMRHCRLGILESIASGVMMTVATNDEKQETLRRSDLYCSSGMIIYLKNIIE